jgi:hypothetical protein
MHTAYRLFTALICLVALGAVQAAAAEQKSDEHQHDQKPYVGSEAFERMKQLVGTWEGMHDMGQGPMKTTVSYKLTSGGSTIVETHFEGAPHEMVTMYYDGANKKLNLTHYCMLRNRPQMTLKNMSPKAISFDYVKNAGLDATKDDHMHALTINFEGKDKIVQQWTRHNGTKKESMEMAFTRVK